MARLTAWHEFLHNVLPSRVHDAEFRRLEVTWSNASKLNASWEQLSENWDLDADRQSSSSTSRRAESAPFFPLRTRCIAFFQFAGRIGKYRG